MLLFTHTTDCYSAHKLLKCPSKIPNTHLNENRTSIVTYVNELHKEVRQSSQGVKNNNVGVIQLVPKHQLLPFDDARDKSVSLVEITSSEENMTVQSGSMNPSEGLCCRGFPLSMDQSSEELDGGHVCLAYDERFDMSSPMYNVSLDDRLEPLSYDEDATAIEMLDRDDKSNDYAYQEMYDEEYPDFYFVNDLDDSFSLPDDLYCVAAPIDMTNGVHTRHIAPRKRTSLPIIRKLTRLSCINLQDCFWEQRKINQNRLSLLSRRRQERSYIGRIHVKSATAMRNKCFNPAGWNRGILNKVAHRVSFKTSSSKPVQFEGLKPLSEILKEKMKMNFGTE